MRPPLFRVYLLRFLTLVIVALLLFEFYVFLCFSRDKRAAVDKKYVRDYERVLCSFSKTKIKIAGGKGRCPNQGIVTTFKHGSLANNMWQLANVIACSLTTGLDPYIPDCLIESLEEVFVNVTVPPLSTIGHCFVPLPDSAASLEDWMDVQQSIVIRSSDLYGENVIKNIRSIRDHFVFKTDLAEMAQRVLLAAKRNNTKEVTYVGVYITRTSIIVNQEYDDVYPSVQFFLDAMKHFRKEFPDAVFVVITDRKGFWEYVLWKKNVYVIDEDLLSHPGAPLAVLSHCNHSILASEDFAVWAAILTGGKAIVSLCLSEDFNGLMQQNNDWNYLQNNTKSINKFLDTLF